MAPTKHITTLKERSTEGKKTRRPSNFVARMTASASSPPRSAVKAPARVAWSQHPERTERLLDYLDGHRNLASQLFADDTQAAKLTAEEIKRAYSQIAHHVFYHDDEVAVQVDVRRKPQKYATSVKNYIYTLKKQYHAANKRIDTGAGVKAEDVIPGSLAANLIELEMKNFQWWSRLHRLL